MWRLAQTLEYSRENSRSIGRAPAKYLRSLLPPLATPRSFLLSALNSYQVYTWIFIGVDAHRLVSVARCKPRVNPHDTHGMSEHLPAELTQQHALNASFSPISLPRATLLKTPFQPPVNASKWGRSQDTQSIRGRGGVVAVMHETHWTRLSSHPSWEQERDLSSPLATISCSTGPALLTSTAKLAT